jgi:hypothetical protein
MARPLRIEFPGALYHGTARWNAQQDIFLDDEDRQRFKARNYENSFRESLEETNLISIYLPLSVCSEWGKALCSDRTWRLQTRVISQLLFDAQNKI